MTTSAIKIDPVGVDAHFDDVAPHVRLSDGRESAVPIAWFPRLAEATCEARAHWRWVGGRIGMHWPDLDENISIRGPLVGR